MTIRDTIDRAIGEVVFNASNFPERVQARILGQNMAPLRARLTDAVVAALSSPPADDVREAELRELHHFEVEQQLTETLAAIERVRTEVDGTEWTDASWRHQREAVGRILSTIERGIPTGEVRLRGTVTEPTVDLVEVIGVALAEWRSDPVDLSAPHAPSLAEYVADAVWRAQGHQDARGTVTDAERAAINEALIEVLPIWTSEIETEYARSALLKTIVPALEAARGARVSAENPTPTNHPDGSL